VFEQKKTKQDEQKNVCSGISSREVGENAPLVTHSNIFNFNRPVRIHRAAGLFIRVQNQREKLWNSLNDVTLSNNWPSCGNAVPEIFIYWLKVNDLHAFVLVEAKAVFALRKNMLSPLKMLTR
jgi:hypothetical protein